MTDARNKTTSKTLRAPEKKYVSVRLALRNYQRLIAVKARLMQQHERNMGLNDAVQSLLDLSDHDGGVVD